MCQLTFENFFYYFIKIIKNKEFSMNVVSSVSSNVEIKPQTVTKKEADKPAEKSIENGETKVAMALTALASIGLAAVAIKKGKAKSAGKIVKNSVDDIARAASEQVRSGASISSVKKGATKNLSHEGKKVVKQAISAANDEKLAKQALVRQTMIKQGGVAKKAPGSVKNLMQGTKGATEDVLQGKIETAKQLADEAVETAKKMKDTAVQIPSRKNRRYAQYAHNQAETARAKALRVEEKATKLIQETREKAVKKAEATARTQASPNYAAGQIKMKEQSAKAAANSVKRKALRDTSKPGYQRAYAKFNGYSPEKLQGVIASKNSSAVEKKVAGDLLAALH